MFWKNIFEDDNKFQSFLENVKCWDGCNWATGPRTATIMVTGHCNYKCNYCYFKNNAFGEYLTCENWKHIIDQLADMGVSRVAFTGGEPLLYEHLGKLIRYASACGVKTAVISNGSLAKLKEIKTLADAGLSSFIVSLDTVNRELYNNISGTTDIVFERVINTLPILSRELSCWFGVICVLSPQVIPYLADLLDYCRMHRIPVQFQPFLETNEMTALPVYEIEKVADIIEEASLAGTYVVNSVSFIRSMKEFAITKKLPEDTQCCLPFHEIYFNPDGSVKACCISDIVGDTRLSSVKNIWEGEDYRKWRKKALGRKCLNCMLISHELMFKKT